MSADTEMYSSNYERGQEAAEERATIRAGVEARDYLKPLLTQLCTIQEQLPEADSFVVNKALTELYQDLDAAAGKLSAAIAKVGL